jgi:succinate dehydrogenase / fumarate reductase cytochrome b subunit
MSIIKLLTSSVGRKILMAITGLLLSFFMAFHLFGNLFLFVGEAAFNGYVEKLHKLGFLIRIAEFFLVLFVFSHAYSGILLWIKNRKAKKVVSSYSKENTPGAAKYAAFTGSIVFIFLATHWSTFWYKFNFDLRGMSYYYVVTESQLGLEVLWSQFFIL